MGVRAEAQKVTLRMPETQKTTEATSGEEKEALDTHANDRL